MRLSILSAVFLLLAAFSHSGAAREANPLDAAPSRFTTLEGTKIHYKSLGTGSTALVFIHGWTCDLTFWREQVPAFDGKIRMVFLDLPGHGKSDKPEIPYTMDLFARAVDAVLRDAGVSKVILAGHSMGTPVARQFYRLHPEKTLGIVDVDGMLHVDLKPGEADTLAARYADADWKQKQTKAVEEMFTPATTPTLRRKILGTMTAAPQYVVASAFKGIFDPAIWTDDPIGVPVLAIYSRSAFRTLEYEAAVRKLAPHVQFVYVEGVGHFLHLEKPAKVNEAIVVFLSSRGWIAA
jgi:pimeloyl-ACP methyl ester carboxylesterase